jgi:hypothetical protein
LAFPVENTKTDVLATHLGELDTHSDDSTLPLAVSLCKLLDVVYTFGLVDLVPTHFLVLNIEVWQNFDIN